ncbi:MAG TPA: ABC transporter permease [Vicinamibacterales bacterium]|nr:ABC transporter permease [Vicinamibacterales bacterium]
MIALFTWGARDLEMDQEMAFHVESITRDFVRAGVSEAEAARAARRRFGSVLRLKEQGHDVRSGHLEQLVHDVKSGLRPFKGSPVFALVAVITLALGTGANAAVLAAVKSALLDALPYPDSNRLVRMYGRLLDGSQERGPLSAGTVSDIAARQRSFASVAAFMDLAIDAVYGSDEGPQIAKITWVAPGFFQTLDVPVTLGRTFGDGDGLSGLVPLSGGQIGPDAPSAVVLAHTAWVRLFGSDPGVIGRDVRINGIPRTVIGVLPRDFIGPMGPTDFYLSFDLGPVLANPIFVRRAQWLGLVGRLKPGVAHEAGQEEIARIWAALAREYPADNGTLGISAMPLRDAMIGSTRTPLLVLMASAGLVLVITCANLAGALLSRALSRRKEFAVRAALGAGRGRLVRQLLTESTVLAMAGGVTGVLLAVFILDVLHGLASPALPVHANLSLDWGSVLITGVLALCTGLAFGVAPALSVDRAGTQGTLREETRGSSEGRSARRLRGALVAGQMALCVSLLVGTGLLTRSLWAMTGASLGFDPEGVVTGTIQLPSRDYATPQQRDLFREQFTERVRALPGVAAVATATSIPTAVRQRSGVTIEGAPPDDAQPFVLAALVSDDYFSTLRIPLRRGRIFDAQDLPTAPPTLVISESMARRFWPGGDAIGARVRMGPDRNSPLIEVIGIVGDVRNDRSRPDAEPMAYRSSRQVPVPLVTFLLRAQGDPLALVTSVERALRQIDPGLPLQQVRTLRAVLGEGLAGRRLPVLLMMAFGALALLLASVGVYSMFASMAAAREREFGVRLALGSRPSAIAMLVLRQGAGWMAAGLGVGAFGIILVVRLVRDLLYQVPPFDPLTLGLSVAILVGCATVALLAPLRRAMRVDAAVMLRAQ